MNPHYRDMLEMPEEAFRELLSERSANDRERLIQEMTEHEEETHSYERASIKEETYSVNAAVGHNIIRGLFSKKKGPETRKVIEDLYQAGHEPGDTKDLEDIYLKLIFGKAVYDRGNYKKSVIPETP